MSIVTSTSADVLIVTDQVAEMIIRSEVFYNYKQARADMDTDEKAQSLISRFNEMKEQYEEVQRFGKYHPDYDQVSKAIRGLKREMDFYDPIARFKKAEKDLEQLLNDISAAVAGAVSPNIKVPTGNPFFDNRACGGGCGSGGRCGCSA